jgi:hypothetical protein
VAATQVLNGAKGGLGCFWALTGVVGFNRYLFSVAVCGPKGQDNLAQGLPWVNFPNRMGPEGPYRTAKIGRRPRPSAFPTPGAPSGLNTFLWATQGKPWAKLSWPFGP